MQGADILLLVMEGHDDGDEGRQGVAEHIWHGRIIRIGVKR
jgi:hypothetical protein